MLTVRRMVEVDDIAPRCILIECGTNENTLEEVLCGIPYLAQAIAETLDALEAEAAINNEE